MARDNIRQSLRRKDSPKRLLRARPEFESPGRLTISRCAKVARTKGLPAIITPEEVRAA